MSLIDPHCSNPPPRRRGRPALAKTKVVRDQRALGLHHFAFLRSVLLGLDLRDSFERYRGPLVFSAITGGTQNQHWRGGGVGGSLISLTFLFTFKSAICGVKPWSVCTRPANTP